MNPLKKGLSKDPSAAEKAVADAQWRSYVRARDGGHADWLVEGQRFDKFYLGEQWDKADIEKLDLEGRPHLTINLTMKIVNAFMGEHDKQRADLKFLAGRDGSAETATMLSKIVEQALEANNYIASESLLFQDGLIVDRGYLDVRLEFERNIQGEINIVAEDPFDIIPDTDAKSPDPKDWNEFHKVAWMTLDIIESHYGEKAREKVESMANNDNDFGYGQDSIRYEASRTFGNEFVPEEPSQGYADETGNVIRSIRVIERQYKQLARVKYFVDPITGEMAQVSHDLQDESIKNIMKTTGVGVVEKVGHRIKWTVTAGDTVLHDEWSPYRTFTLIPFFPFFRRGKASGVVRQLMSPQEQHNKYESQMLHVVNTSANSGWTFETGTLVNMTADELETNGSETGLVLEHQRGTNPPQKIQPNQIPSGLDRIAERTKAAIGEISGIAPEIGDSQTNEVDGVILDSFQTRNMAQVQVPFKALQLTRKLLGDKLLELVQDFYTETRVLRITNWDDLQSGQEEVVINLMNQAGQITNNVSLGEYDVVATTAPAREGFQKAQFAETLIMRREGVMIPDEHVIRLSNLENRFQIADQVASLQGTAPPSEEEMQMSQMQQQLTMAKMQGEVEELAGKAQLLQAQGMLAMAKAQTEQGAEQLEGARQAVEIQKELAKIQAQLTQKREEFANKVEIAKLHVSAKRNDGQFSNATKSFGSELTYRAKLEELASKERIAASKGLTTSSES